MSDRDVFVQYVIPALLFCEHLVLLWIVLRVSHAVDRLQQLLPRPLSLVPTGPMLTQADMAANEAWLRVHGRSPHYRGRFVALKAGTFVAASDSRDILLTHLAGMGINGCFVVRVGNDEQEQLEH